MGSPARSFFFFFLANVLLPLVGPKHVFLAFTSFTSLPVLDLMSRSLIHITELVELICRDMSRATMAQCTLVCRSWYAAFTPYLYRHIRMFYIHPNRIEKRKPVLDLQKYGSHASSLFIDLLWLPPQESINPHCKYLTSLYLNLTIFNPDNNTPLHCTRLVELVKRNPNIHTFQLCRGHSSVVDQILSESKLLRHLPSLTNLVVMNSYKCKSNAFEELMECGPQLRKLDYDIRWEPEKTDSKSNPMSDRPMWTKLVSLTVRDHSGSRAVEVVGRCPNVQSFTAVLLDDEDRHGILRRMAQHPLSGYPSRLEKLDLFGIRGSESVTALVDLVRVCAASSKLKSFRLDCSDVSQEVVETLVRFHAKSLEEVSISLCEHAPDSTGLQEFLSKCPRLRHLEVWSRSSRMRMEDIVQSPWICNDLSVLDARLTRSSPVVLLAVPPHENDRRSALPTIPEGDDNEELRLQQRLWEQIGKLPKLQKLNIIMKKTSRSDSSTLWATKDGVETLLRMKRLTEFTVSSERYPLTDGDRERLLRSQPKLRIRHPH